MADWRIVTPTRAPTDDELGGTDTRAVVLERNIFYSSPDITNSYSITYLNDYGGLVRFNISIPSLSLHIYYSIEKKGWTFSPKGGDLVDITAYDLTIPEDLVTSAEEIYPYFYTIAYEKGTTACKLAVTNEAKTLIRNALINKGVDVPDTTPFRQYAGKIEGIETGSNIEILTFDIQPDDYENVSSWYDEAYMNQYTEATWSIHGPYKFKLKTYNSLDDLKKDVPIGNIYFSCGEQVFIKRPTALNEGSNFKFISENLGLSGQTLVMIVNFGGGM